MVYTWGENERGVDKRLNQIQGKSAGFNANIQVLEEHKVRPFKENKHTDHVSVAFMARAPHKFTENLFAQSEVVQEETLKTMATWLLSHPKNKVSQVDSPDAILVLTQLVSSPNDVVRERTTQVLALLATVHQGVEGMLAVGTVPELLKRAATDSNEATRHNAHAALQKIGELPEGASAIVAASGTVMLVEVCKQQVSPDALLTLKACLGDPWGLSDALDAGAISVMTAALSNRDPSVLQSALKNLAFLTNPAHAKEEAIAAGAVGPVCKHLQHAEWAVRAAAACSIASIALDVDGKKKAFEAGAAQSLIGLLRDKNLPVVLLSVRALGVLAEYKRHCLSTPLEGVYRSVFDKALPQLRLLMASSDRVLAKTARDTEALITWRP